MRREIFCVCLSAATLVCGCAGRQAYPVDVYTPGDENRSCRALTTEIESIKQEMAALRPRTNKFGYNAICFVGGVFLIVPFFFMDLKNAEKVEYRALGRRRERLIAIAVDKGCDLIAGAKLELDDSGSTRRVVGYKVDTTRKDAAGNFLTYPVYEDEK